MRWLVLTLFLSGCTIVLWSDNSVIITDTGIGDDVKTDPLPNIKRLKNVTNQ